METSSRTLGDFELTIHTVKTLVVGAGLAGLNAAERLAELGHDDVVIATTRTSGTSSDPAAAKPTYYRMGMDWENPDSPAAFAETLVDRGMTHGDTAYVEGVNSIPAFLHLVSNGVPFPRDEYGAFTGSGEHGRQTSAGPQTSALMAERSQERVKSSRIRTLSRHTVIALLTAGEGPERRCVGALAVALKSANEPKQALVVFNARNVVLATGGAGALFESSIRSNDATSSLGLGIKAGAAAANLTETRFGLAFAKGRRRIAGNYQRVIPAYHSTSRGGRTPNIFLGGYFHATKQIASAIFGKGDWWPFSTGRLQGMGPAIVDIAVHNELAQRNRVYVSFAENVHGPEIGQFNIGQLDEAAKTWLERNGATQFTPFDRLRHVDPESIDELLDYKIDLREPQEVTLCAEDTFGGLAVDTSWQTTLPGLFAVGDVACTHGDPPEGAGLNASIVGGMRVAEHIARHGHDAPLTLDALMAAITPQLDAEIANLRRYVYGPSDLPSVKNITRDVQRRMSDAAGMVRGTKGLTGAIAETEKTYGAIRSEGQRMARQSEFVSAVENELLCLTQLAFLHAMKDYIEAGGGSRGAFLILDEHGDATVLTKQGGHMPHRNENMGMRNEVLEVQLVEGTTFETRTVPVRPIPQRGAGPGAEA
jgi:succinate dehydrogenase/fumarate reductase flavoprotein subunit